MKDGEKSIHDAESIWFMKEIIGAGKWQENVLRNGLTVPGLEIERFCEVGNLKSPSDRKF